MVRQGIPEEVALGQGLRKKGANHENIRGWCVPEEGWQQVQRPCVVLCPGPVG